MPFDLCGIYSNVSKPKTFEESYVLCLEAKSFEVLCYWQGVTAFSSLAAPTADKTMLCYHRETRQECSWKEDRSLFLFC